MMRIWLRGFMVVLVAAGCGGTGEVSSLGASLSEAEVGPRPRTMPAGFVVTPESQDNEGGVDDTARVQSAIDTAATVDGGITWLSRHYEVSRSLRVPSHARIVGSGPEAIIHFNWIGRTGPGALAYFEGSPDGGSDYRFENFEVHGATDGGPSGSSRAADGGLAPGLRLHQASGLVVRQMRFSDVPANGITVFGARDLFVDHNDFFQMGRGGVTVFPARGFPTREVHVNDNRIRGLGDDAIAVSSTTAVSDFDSKPFGIHIENNLISSFDRAEPAWIAANAMQGRGIAVLGGDQVFVLGNSVRSVSESGVLIRGSNFPGQLRPDGGVWTISNVTVSGNRISHIGQNAAGEVRGTLNYFLSAGVEVELGRQVKVFGNEVSNTVDPAYVVSKCSGCSVP